MSRGLPANIVRDVGVVGDARRSEVLAELADQARRIAPVTLAGERRIPVSPALCDLLPDGIQQGSVVGVGGPGARSLALVLIAGALGGDRWAAMVGCDDICLAAADAVGVPMHRLIVVDPPRRSSWSAVVGSLVDAFAVVAVAPKGKVRIGDVGKLRNRVRDRGSVLIDLSGAWPEAHDLSMRVVQQEWVGLGRGHGVLQARRVEVEVGGRRHAHRGRSATLWLPGPDGVPAADIPTIERHAGSDIEAIDGSSLDRLRSAS